MDNKPDPFAEFEAKMRLAGVKEAPLRAFKHSYESLRSGDTGMIAEASIQPVVDLPHLEEVEAETELQPQFLSQAVVVKLNGGLGTSMGLERAKSLLVVTNGLSFLDFIVKQVLHVQQQYGLPVRFILMN